MFAHPAPRSDRLAGRSFRLLLAVAIFAGAAPAGANGLPPHCAKRGDLYQQLAQRFQEAPVARGLANNGALVEVFSAPDGGTWTVTITMPNGVACMVAAGDDWENLPRVADLGPPA